MYNLFHTKNFKVKIILPIATILLAGRYAHLLTSTKSAST